MNFLAFIDEASKQPCIHVIFINAVSLIQYSKCLIIKQKSFIDVRDYYGL